MPGYNVLLRNSQLDAITTFAGGGALMRIYGGVQPATGGAVTTQLVNDFVLGTPFAPAAASAALAPTLPTAKAGSAAGTATWFRIFKADGTTQVIDGTVGTTGTDLIVNTATISVGVNVSITSFAINRGNA